MVFEKGLECLRFPNKFRHRFEQLCGRKDQVIVVHLKSSVHPPSMPFPLDLLHLSLSRRTKGSLMQITQARKLGKSDQMWKIQFFPTKSIPVPGE